MIRPATLADLPAVAAVERSAAGLFAGTHMAWAVEGPTLPRWRLRAGVARGLLLVADTGRVAGFIIASPAYGTLFIEEFSVARDHQRHGLGRELLAALEALASAHGAAALTLTTDRTLAWNAPFYARCGFAEVAGPDWLMARLRRPPGREFRCAMKKPLPSPCETIPPA